MESFRARVGIAFIHHNLKNTNPRPFVPKNVSMFPENTLTPYSRQKMLNNMANVHFYDNICGNWMSLDSCSNRRGLKFIDRAGVAENAHTTQGAVVSWVLTNVVHFRVKSWGKLRVNDRFSRSTNRSFLDTSSYHINVLTNINNKNR